MVQSIKYTDSSHANIAGLVEQRLPNIVFSVCYLWFRESVQGTVSRESAFWSLSCCYKTRFALNVNTIAIRILLTEGDIEALGGSEGNGDNSLG